MPAGRMKMGKEHRVPLCDRAIAILKALPRDGTRVFALSDMAMLMCLRGLRPGLSVHGFRSSFMDWAHEQTAFPKSSSTRRWRTALATRSRPVIGAATCSINVKN